MKAKSLHLFRKSTKSMPARAAAMALGVGVLGCGMAVGNIVIYESYVILSGGPQNGDYYYEMKDNGGNNSTFSSINHNINLLSSPSLLLKGGEVKTTATNNDYQNSNNRETLNWRLYRDGTTAPS
jgi:hypothetical protein